MDEKINKINDKMIGNAISAYLMVFISWLFLFNKINPNINNDFVKGHTKSAILIHISFIITMVIFITNNLFSGIYIVGFSLNNIIAQIISIILLSLMTLGIYRATKGLDFKIAKNISITKKLNILDIDGNGKITEKEKITIILSFIPFIGFLTYGKYKNNTTIQESTRLNIIISLIIIFLYIFGYSNLANLTSLIYIILVSFIGINLFTREELIHIRIPYILSPKGLYQNTQILLKYLYNYFSENNFKTFNILKKEYNIELDAIENNNELFLSKNKDLRPNKILIYIPIINLVFLFFKDTKYSFHIINGLMITFLLAFTGILAKFGYFNAKLHILALFPILFGITYSKYTLAYKMPIIYDLYLVISKIISVVSFGVINVRERRKKVVENSFKVKKD